MSTAKSKLSRVRAKISILARIQASLSKSNTQSQEDCHARKHIPDSWKESFENILDDPAGVKAFTEFSQKEHSEENIKFWVACTDYLKIKDSIKRAEEAKNIFSTYLSDSATDPVNVDSHARKLVKDDLENPNEQTFEVARKQIFILMKTDSYRRFLKSDAPICPCNTEEGSPKPNKKLKERMNSNGSLVQSSPAKVEKPVSRRQSDSDYANSLVHGARESTKPPKPNLSSGDLPAAEAKTIDIERIEETSETLSAEEEHVTTQTPAVLADLASVTEPLTMKLIPSPILRQSPPTNPPTPNQPVTTSKNIIEPTSSNIHIPVANVIEALEPSSPAHSSTRESPNQMSTISNQSIVATHFDNAPSHTPIYPHSPLLEGKDAAIALDSDYTMSTYTENNNRTRQSPGSSPSHAYNVISDTDLQSAIDEINALTVCMKDELVSVVQPKLNLIKQRCNPASASELSH